MTQWQSMSWRCPPARKTYRCASWAGEIRQISPYSGLAAGRLQRRRWPSAPVYGGAFDSMLARSDATMRQPPLLRPRSHRGGEASLAIRFTPSSRHVGQSVTAETWFILVAPWLCSACIRSPRRWSLQTADGVLCGCSRGISRPSTCPLMEKGAALRCRRGGFQRHSAIRN